MVYETSHAVSLFPVKVLKCYYNIYICIISVVFMGSEKYPDENEFDVFIKKHGGSDIMMPAQTAKG